MLTEGPAWENDKVGFRIYMDVRNQKDIWGKRVPEMVLDQVGTDHTNSYHKLNNWGMDILIVGKSLAAGSLAAYIPQAGAQPIRLGGERMGKIIYEEVTSGPVRAIFRMHYPEWDLLGNGEKASLTEEIHISGGNYFYDSKIKLKNAPVGTQLVTGMVNLSSKTSHEFTTKNKITGFYSYDIQTDNKDHLGMAITVPKSEWVQFGTIGNEGEDIKNTYTVYMKPDSKGEANFRFYAGWELSNPQFKTKQGFEDYVKQETESQSAPIVIK